MLGLTRSDGRYVGAPVGETVVRPGDVLVVYGHSDQLREPDEQLSDHAGSARS